MPKLKINPSLESKLSTTINKINQKSIIEKSGFVTSSNDKTTHYKIKTFRLRQLDAMNLEMIIKEVNKSNPRKIYSDSEIIRGLINYISDNINSHIKKLSTYIKNSS